MYISKQEDQFISWLCGKDVKFPFFKNLPIVPMPEMKKEVKPQCSAYPCMADGYSKDETGRFYCSEHTRIFES